MSDFHVLGLDLSLNHAGFVRLDSDGNLAGWGYVTDRKSRIITPNGMLLPASDSTDRQQVAMERLGWWRKRLNATLNKPSRFSEFVGIEDYAFAAPGHAHATAELGGLARLETLCSGAGLRLLDPTTVKLFGAGKGNATALEVVQGVKDSWGISFAQVTRAPKAGCKPDTLAEEDLCAAYVVARIVWTEVMLREGEIALNSLPEHQIRVFNRITKANPVNVLAREFLYLPREATNKGAV